MKLYKNYTRNYSNNIRVQHFLKFPITIFIIIYLLSVFGCAPSITLKKDTILSNQSVSISKNISLPETMFYQGRNESILGAFGLVGAMAAESGRKKTSDVIKYVMNKSNIDMPQIVRGEFEQQLKNTNLFSTIQPDGGNYPELKLSIRVYGFGQPQGLPSQLKPLLGVVGELVTPDGSVLWKKYDYVTNLNGKTPSHTLEEYFNDPELIREAFNTASQIVVSGLIDHMNTK